MKTMLVAAIAVAIYSVFSLYKLVGGADRLAAPEKVRHGDKDSRRTPDGGSGRTR